MTKSSLPVGGYSVNPYVGCPHACRYCYASVSYTHLDVYKRQIYAELFSQLIDCQHIKRSLILGGLILDQVNHLGKLQIEIVVMAGQRCV